MDWLEFVGIPRGPDSANKKRDRRPIPNGAVTHKVLADGLFLVYRSRAALSFDIRRTRGTALWKVRELTVYRRLIDDRVVTG